MFVCGGGNMKNILIIGGGLSGLSCAIELAENGISSILVSPYPSERAQSVMADKRNQSSVQSQMPYAFQKCI